MIQPCQLPLGIGGVAGYEIEFVIFCRDQPTLRIQFFNAKTVGNGNGLLLCENGCSGIALLLGIVPELVIAGKGKIDLSRLKFGFLQTEEISIDAVKKFGETFPHTSS